MERQQLEICSEWKAHIALDRRSYVHEMEAAEEGVDAFLIENDMVWINVGDRRRIKAEDRILNTQRLRLINFEGRPYAVETIQDVWGEQDGDCNFLLKVHYPSGEEPKELGDKLREVAESAIKSH